MTDSLTAAINLLASWLHVKDLDLADPKDQMSKTYQQAFTYGTGSAKADLVFRDQRTLGDGATEDLDLAGVLTDAFGATLPFAKIKALVIKNNTAGQVLTVGNAATNGWQGPFGAVTHTLAIQGEGFALLVCGPVGFAVTPDTGDKLKIANSAGASVIYDIIIIGASA